MDRFCGLYVSIIEPFSSYVRESLKLYSLRGWVDRAVRMFAGSYLEGFQAIRPDTTLVSLYSKTNSRSNFQLYSGTKIYKFRAVSLPIIGSFPLYIRHWHMLYSFDDS